MITQDFARVKHKYLAPKPYFLPLFILLLITFPPPRGEARGQFCPKHFCQKNHLQINKISVRVHSD